MMTRFGLAPRRAGLSISEFQTHWHDKHGPLVRKFKGVKRIWQNHALLRDGMPLLPWTGFDSCAELDFDDLAAMKFAMSEENYPPELHADTPHMVDMTKAAPMPCERIHITGGVDLSNVRLLTFMRRASGRAQAELNEALRALPKAYQARAREIYLAPETPDPKTSSFDAVDAQWFETPEQAERYVVSAEAGEHRDAIAHLVRGVERLIARVRVIL
jgi:uncharacterized protein (TIGR02118 family)